MNDQYISLSSHEKIKEKIAFQSRLLEAVHDSIVVADVDGIIEFWNKGSERLFGWTADEIIGLPFAVLIEENFLKEIPKSIVEIQSGIWEGKVIIITKNKKRKYVRVSITAMYNQLNKPTNLVGVFSDITELIESKHKAEEALRSKSEFLANISHEIRTPITAILGYVELLNYLTLEDKQKDYLQSIQDNTEQLLVLINDLLDISKIDADKIIVDESEFNLKNLIYSVIKIFEPNIHKKALKLSLEFSSDLPETIISDKIRIKQILSNLLSNAVKFTEKGGIKLIFSKSETINNDFKLHAEIIDTGIGIDQAKLNTIFEPFTQADSSTTRKYGGTGLGLAISKKLIEILQGEIIVESEVDKGSKFSFSIPVTSSTYTSNKDLFFNKNFDINLPKLLLISTNEKLFDELTQQNFVSKLQILWLKNQHRISSAISFYEPEIIAIDYDSVPVELYPNANASLVYCIGNCIPPPITKDNSYQNVNSLDTLIDELNKFSLPQLITSSASNTLSILIIDEDPVNSMLMEKILRNNNYQVEKLGIISTIPPMIYNQFFDIILVNNEFLKKYCNQVYKLMGQLNYKVLIAIAKSSEQYNEELINDVLLKPVTSQKLLAMVKKHTGLGV